MRVSILSLAIMITLILPVSPLLADPDETSEPFAFDLVNPPFETVLEKAKAEKKTIFVDFYAPG